VAAKKSQPDFAARPQAGSPRTLTISSFSLAANYSKKSISNKLLSF